jgi:hypothetical protein
MKRGVVAISAGENSFFFQSQLVTLLDNGGTNFF